MIHPPGVVEKYVPDAEVVFWLLLTSPLWTLHDSGLCRLHRVREPTWRSQAHPSTTLRSRSPCASWAPPLTGGLCGDLSPHRTTMTQTKCCPVLHFGSWWGVQRYIDLDFGGSKILEYATHLLRMIQ